jgi:transcriptional regulator with XRE-family HTH domain
MFHFNRISVDFKELGEQIAELRCSKKISQQHIADAVGISRATVNALETGRAGDVGIRKAFKILDYLGYEIRIKEKARFPTLEELRGD